MYRIITLIILLSSCSPIERNCNDFKKGDFSSEIIIDGVSYVSVFSRNDSIQIENFQNKIDTSYVRWINDCEVIFKTMNPKNMIEKLMYELKII